jgi:hypothetical protein
MYLGLICVACFSADKVRRKALLLKFPKKMSEMKRKRLGSAYGDYLTSVMVQSY